MKGRQLSRSAAVSAAVALMGVAGLALASKLSPPLGIINETPSLPKGLYLRVFSQELAVGGVVAIEQPAAARPYLASLGVAPDMWILKRIAAIGGEKVCASQGVLSTPIGQFAVAPRDRRGVRLPVWRDCRRLQSKELLLLGDTSTSFDGRYFGPVPRAAVKASYQPVLLW